MAIRPHDRFALPKGWPRRVRSAVIHTISLPQTSLTHARSVAANSVNARIRLKEENDRLRNDALVRVSRPVNKFPDFVGYLVCRLKVLCPTMGKARIANVLCRAGLHLGTTTVRRMLRDSNRPEPTKRRDEPATTSSEPVVTAREPNHVWHWDLTTVPTALGFWIPWLPQALPQRWPFCWWVAVAIDHYSRRVMGIAVFLQQPSSKAVQTFLESAIRAAGKAPDHLINDHGKQFVARSFKRWCRRKGIRQRFGSIGQYG